MTYFSWLSRDGHLLYLTKSITSFTNNFVSVIFAIFLTLLGIPLWQVGLILTGGLLSSTLLNTITGFFADRIGRRKMLIFYALLTTLSGLVYAFVNYIPILILTAVLSTLGAKGGFGPVDMLERVILAQSCPSEKRTRMYAIRSTMSSLLGAMGYLFGGSPTLFQSLFNIDQFTSFQVMFLIYAVLSSLVLALYLLLSNKVEMETDLIRKKSLPLSPKTKSIVTKLSLLFSMDSFGGGLLTSTLVSYWFFQRFSLSIDVISFIFFISSILAAISFMLATKLAEKIGLIKTMVYSHLPANIMTVFIPYMPTSTTSAVLYTSRSLLSQMDVPTRQSYTMAIVSPEERTRVGGLINLPRSIAKAVSPTIAGVLMQFVGLSIPFLITGAIKIIYDISLYFTFRNIKPPEEKNQDKS